MLDEKDRTCSTFYYIKRYHVKSICNLLVNIYKSITLNHKILKNERSGKDFSSLKIITSSEKILRNERSAKDFSSLKIIIASLKSLYHTLEVRVLTVISCGGPLGSPSSLFFRCWMRSLQCCWLFLPDSFLESKYFIPINVIHTYCFN